MAITPSGHAADVTHRVACIFNNSGIAQACIKSTSQSRMLLATLIGACLHDFEHPQVCRVACGHRMPNPPPPPPPCIACLDGRCLAEGYNPKLRSDLLPSGVSTGQKWDEISGGGRMDRWTCIQAGL